MHRERAWGVLPVPLSAREWRLPVLSLHSVMLHVRLRYISRRQDRGRGAKRRELGRRAASIADRGCLLAGAATSVATLRPATLPASQT